MDFRWQDILPNNRFTLRSFVSIKAVEGFLCGYCINPHSRLSALVVHRCLGSGWVCINHWLLFIFRDIFFFLGPLFRRRASVEGRILPSNNNIAAVWKETFRMTSSNIQYFCPFSLCWRCSVTLFNECGKAVSKTGSGNVGPVLWAADHLYPIKTIELAVCPGIARSLPAHGCTLLLEEDYL